MADIALHQLSKTYANGFRALDNLNLTIADGELLVLVGPSGCGKTTTLRLIAGLDEPTSGEIRLGGRSLAGVPPCERDLAMVFQKPSLAPNRTVAQNLNFGNDLRRGLLSPLLSLFSGKLRAKRHSERVAIEAMAQLLGLTDVLAHRPAQLSGGQLQRVALGRTLLRRPAARLLDEPLGQLDGPLRRQLRTELHLLQRRFPATMIYVTHDSEEALALGERIAVLHHGVLLQVDSAEALLARPRHRFVAEFFPTPAGPMNFLEGRIVPGDGTPVFACRGMNLSPPVWRRETWQRCVGRQVSLAVRPEDVSIEGAGPMRVILAEPRVNGTLVTCGDDEVRLAGLVPFKESQAFAVGSAAGVKVNLEQGWIFDAKDGVNLELPV